jgi:DNA polymerase III subunit alpha, Gram-positive type
MSNQMTSLTELLQELRFSSYEVSYFDGGVIEGIRFFKDEARLELKLQLKRSLPYAIYQDLKSRLEAKTHSQVTLEMKAGTCDLSLKEIQDYIKHILSREDQVLDTNLILLENDALYFIVEQSTENLQEQLQNLTQDLKQLGIPYPCMIKRNEVEEVMYEVPLQEVQVERPNPNTKPKRLQKKQAKPVLIQDLELGQKGILVRGKIFQIDQQNLRNQGSIRQTLYMHDETDAIAFTVFLDDEIKIQRYSAFSEGSCVEVYGDVVYDNYSKDIQLFVRDIQHIPDWLEQYDEASLKRVELHVHTNMSEMDGVSDVSTYLKQAFRFGHRAMAITDHHSVQSFPKAQRTVDAYLKANPTKKFTLIYGLELNMVDDRFHIAHQAKGQSISDSTYVIFDLETTGLSVIDDDIIEISALKIRNGLILDQFQSFVHTEQELNAFIREKTHIQASDLSEAPSFMQVFPQFKAFVGDAVMVAHNARFDRGFLDEKCRFHHFAKLDNTMIDTLDLARALLSDRRTYRLGVLAKLFRIPYDESVAHRADYDTNVLSQVFLKLLTHEQLEGLSTVDELNQLNQALAYAKNTRYHVNLLAKNQSGLKALFQLTTLAHTSRLVNGSSSNKAEGEGMAEPRILRSDISAYRKDLLVGSSCFNSEVFDCAATGSLAELEACLQFYDYIEIQPLDNYRPLIENHTIPTQERLITILKRMIDTAQRLNKIVIASGDVHYNHPIEKRFRDIYIQAKSVGAQRHPLYIYAAARRHHSIAPDQHYRNTEDMLKEFAYLGDEMAMQLVCYNTHAIANQIEPAQAIKHELFTPSIEGADDNLKKLVELKATSKYGLNLPEVIRQRIDKELTSIVNNGFGVIYYTAHLLVKRSIEEGYMVGSRGSVGSSLVAHLMDITEVNPLAPHYVCPECHHIEFVTSSHIESGYDLANKACPQCASAMQMDGQDIPFETFLGFEGDKVPDIDLNFSGEYQERAHAHTKEIFGENNVYRAGTISTVAQRTAYGYVKGYYEEMNQELPSRQAYITYLAKGCEGVKRTSGQHPGGIIVIPQAYDVHDFTPVQYPANKSSAEWLTTHFEFADIHDNLLKLDLLGHVDPTAMRFLQSLTQIDVRTIPLNDPKVISLFSSTQALDVQDPNYREKTGAVGLPEFGTGFVRQILEVVHPKSFSDLVKVSGLSHGTDVWLNNAKTLIEQGYPFADVIGCRDDIMLYLIQKKLPLKLAFDIMESVRKGRGLKDEWISVMSEHHIPQWYIQSCLRIKYMFPKAHAVAYVLMAVRVAWFKVYYPLAYYASYFTLRATSHDYESYVQGSQAIFKRLRDIQARMNDAQLKQSVSNKEEDMISSLEVAYEMLSRGYRFSPLDINHSHATEFIFDPHDEKALIPPFIVVDGLGENVANSIMLARSERAFISKQDVLSRTQLNQSLVKKLESWGVLEHLDEANQMSLF